MTNKEKFSLKAKGLFNDFLSAVGKTEESEMKKRMKENLQKKLIDINFEVNYSELKKKEIEFKKVYEEYKKCQTQTKELLHQKVTKPLVQIYQNQQEH